MQQLATGPWAGKIDGGRISWCVQTCEEYLSYRLEQLLLKDLRRLGHGMPTLVEPSLLPTCPHGVRDLVYKLSSRALRLLDVGSCYNPFLSWPQFVVTAIDIAPATEVSSCRMCVHNNCLCILQSVLECDFLSVDIVSMDGQLQEAPSYQPNQPGHEEGIDCTPHPPGTEHQQLLMPPGTEHQQLLMPLGTVHQLMPLGTEHQPMPPGMEHQLMPPGTEQLVDCRPGTVQCQPIKPPGTDMFVGSQQGTEQCTDHDAAVHLLSVRRGVARPVMVIHQLCGDYFHVVVFSLLLSYLPCTTQRLLCCINAHRVLQLHGLLLVVSPDSSHQNRHASLMVGWRHCIEAVGFHRYDSRVHAIWLRLGMIVLVL